MRYFDLAFLLEDKKGEVNFISYKRNKILDCNDVDYLISLINADDVVDDEEFHSQLMSLKDKLVTYRCFIQAYEIRNTSRRV